VDGFATRLSLAVGVALIGALLAAANSSASMSAHCQAEGTINFMPPIQLLSANGGTYLYDDIETACAGTIDGAPDVFTLDLNNSGEYASRDCTTQSFDSTVSSGTVATSTAGNVGRSFTFPYHIAASAGIGTIWFTTPAQGGGSLGIAPIGPQLPPMCTDKLAVAGGFSLRIP
jgi:hypothetical protein